MKNIIPASDFQPDSYELLPFRFDTLKDDQILITNEVGEFQKLKRDELLSLTDGTLSTNSALFADLTSKSFVTFDGFSSNLRMLASKYKTRKSFLNGGPGLHIFVLTLRCENSCEYCQVTRRSQNSKGHDMSFETAKEAVDIMFESPSANLTVEFQGGEALLAYDVLKFTIEYCEKLNNDSARNIQYVVASSLQSINVSMLEFFKKYNVNISTSLDGPRWLHNQNRPNSCKDSYEKTIKGISLARAWLGTENIAAMTTLTQKSLSCPELIVDEYVKNGFHSIFLRPLNMYGFAVKKESKISYTTDAFLNFYKKALHHVLNINKSGYHLDEVTATLALNNMLSPYSMGYVDMRSPCGDGTGVLVYNYNGKVYPSDESRMLVEMGDDRFCLGTVEKSYKELINSEVILEVLSAGVAESLPGCAYCAYLPYCGADPIHHYSRQGDLVGNRTTSSFCGRQKNIYKLLFELIDNHSNLDVFNSWINNNSNSDNGLQYDE